MPPLRREEATLKILCIGDVVGAAGCETIRAHLPQIRKTYGIDLVIANGENSAEGNGITPFSADHLFASGVDVITGGNHVFRRKEIFSYLDNNPMMVRPANYPVGAPGRGYTVVDTSHARVCVINLMGTVFMDSLENPFKTADAILASEEAKGAVTLVDFHAEATSEKRSMGFYLDGRVSAVFGTHTHVPTADACLLPHGTAYITDLGMAGPIESVLGVEPKLTIRRFLTKMPVRFSNASGPCSLNGIILDINNLTFKANTIQTLQIK